MTFTTYREPLRATILRTGAIAIVLGGVFAGLRGRLGYWPVAALLMLWPSFGGHWVEVWFLNWLRPRIPAARGVQILARVATWFVGGSVLGAGLFLTGMKHWPAWWVGGVGFIGIELVAHVALQVRGYPSFYNGRG